MKNLFLVSLPKGSLKLELEHYSWHLLSVPKIAFPAHSKYPAAYLNQVLALA
jgi:hypothetical protein